MDKLRALQYFVAAAEASSFSGAARRLDVSMQAVQKLINALERELGASLFDRGPKGLALTASGIQYFERCRGLLEQLASADDSVTPGRPRGTVVVGLPGERAERILGPALPHFHARYPHIGVDVRPLSRLTDPEAGAVDVFVMFGWQETPGLVRKFVYQTRYHVVASPQYWSAAGMPQHPADLRNHTCVLYRSGNTLLDVWEFTRAGEKASVRVEGWLASGNRDVLLEAALGGRGVMRATDLTIGNRIRTGDLAPALQDWTPGQAPPVSVLFRPGHRRTLRIRLFVEFVEGIFRGLNADHPGVTAMTAPRPPWWGKRHGRISSASRRHR